MYCTLFAQIVEDVLKAHRCVQTPSMSLLQTTRQAFICEDIANTDGKTRVKYSVVHAREDNLAEADACRTPAHLNR